MTREWKPGDVALVRPPRGGAWAVAVVGRDEGDAAWICTHPGSGHSHALYAVEVRPLVVIDPEDREQVERLLGLFYGLVPDRCSPDKADRLQVALREFADPKPPKPDEPTGLGAVVEDSRGVLWIRNSDGPYEGTTESPYVVWRYRDSLAGSHARSYHEIAAVRVLSEGVQP